AGPFHTAPGGYPTGRSWAPADAVRPVEDAADAAGAVEAAVASGWDTLKVVLHTGLPLLGEDALRALVATAHARGLTVSVHAEGPGQAARAIDAGADVLVHAPWTEPLSGEVLERGRHMTWISTLAIHGAAERRCAIENVRRFRAVGGTVRYGTDMGNGPTPVGPSPAEIRALAEAGLGIDELLLAMTGVAAGGSPDGVRAERMLASTAPPPRDAEELIAWLAGARRLVDLTGTTPAEDR
ncbi:MAG: hypothetical protein QM572_08410, partial [Nocardioides sp.]